jgi:hypothetical protein
MLSSGDVVLWNILHDRKRVVGWECKLRGFCAREIGNGGPPNDVDQLLEKLKKCQERRMVQARVWIPQTRYGWCEEVYRWQA